MIVDLYSRTFAEKTFHDAIALFVHACVRTCSESASESSTSEMGVSQTDISYRDNFTAQPTTSLQHLITTMYDEFDTNVTNLCLDANNR